MNKKKIILIGNIKNTFSLLKVIFKYSNNFDLFVITNKNKKKSDYFNLEPFCKKNKIPIYFTKDINNLQTFNIIKKFIPDYIFCFGWSQILKKELLNIVKDFSLGYHPAKLPQNRGKHPLIWAIVLGLKETASTFFKLDKKVDNGDIINQKKIKISSKDNALSLYKKMEKISCKQLNDILKRIISSKVKRIKIKTNNSNIWRKRNFKDGVINWRMSSLNILNLVKGLYYPYPFAGTYYNGKYISVKKVQIIKKKIQNAEFGKILHLNKNKPHVKCGDYIIKILSYEPKIKFKKDDYFDES